jgi:hypothetical protein
MTNLNNDNDEKLSATSKSVAESIDCIGAIVITYHKDGVSLGVHGLRARQVHKALKQCLKIGLGKIR